MTRTHPVMNKRLCPHCKWVNSSLMLFCANPKCGRRMDSLQQTITKSIIYGGNKK